MIHILHGDDIVTSRKQFSNLREQAVDPITLDGEKISVTDLTQALKGGGLFTIERNVFIENLLSRKKSVELVSLFAVLNSANEANIMLWDGKELPKTITNAFPKATIDTYKLPQVLFSFLDAIKPENGVQLLKLYHTLLKTSEPEMVLFMLIRQFRLLLNIHEKEDMIIEVQRLGDWQRQKLTKQAKLFTEEQLLSLYQMLFALDKGAKTGTLAQPFAAAIDIFLLNI